MDPRTPLTPAAVLQLLSANLEANDDVVHRTTLSPEGLLVDFYDEGRWLVPLPQEGDAAEHAVPWPTGGAPSPVTLGSPLELVCESLHHAFERDDDVVAGVVWAKDGLLVDFYGHEGWLVPWPQFVAQPESEEAWSVASPLLQRGSPREFRLWRRRQGRYKGWDWSQRRIDGRLAAQALTEIPRSRNTRSPQSARKLAARQAKLITFCFSGLFSRDVQ